MKDYTGIKRDMLTAISFEKRINNKTYWLFKCDCGNKKVIQSAKVFLKNNKTVSCGCYKKEIWNKVVLQNKKKYESYTYPIQRTQKDAYFSYKKSAKKRQYEFLISFDFFISLATSNCFYCNSAPNRIHRFKYRGIEYPDFICNGIDRKDNSIGYLNDNCVSCCTNCNRAKNTMGFDDFVNWINFIKTQPKNN